MRIGIVFTPGMSAAVSTPMTPGSLTASALSIFTIRACAQVLRKIAACTMPTR